MRADNLAHGGVVQAFKWASSAVWLIKYASKFQNRRGRQTEKERDSITFGDIQPQLTSLRPARVGLFWGLLQWQRFATLAFTHFQSSTV